MSKVIVYHPWVYLKGGAEKVLLEYQNHSRHQLDLRCGFLGENTFDELGEKCKQIPSRIGHVNVTRNIIQSAKSLLAILSSDFRQCETADVLLISSEGFGDFVSLFGNIPAKRTIAFVHTPLKLAYDEDSLPTTKQRLGSLQYYLFLYVIRPLYKLVNRLVWQRYSAVIANSTETKNRIIAGKLAKPENIHIAYPGVDPKHTSELAPAEHKYKSNTYLIAGRIMVQKNLEMGIAAFLEAAPEHTTLVVAGHCDEKSESYLLALQQQFTSPRIKWVKNPEDDNYQKLFYDAKCLIFPALNEDWGIVPIEAMANAIPVICCNKGGPSESVLDRVTGYHCSPSVNAFATAIATFEELTLSEYKQLSDTAKIRANDFTWIQFAKQLDDIIDSESCR